jgi:hypothetical protein
MIRGALGAALVAALAVACAERKPLPADGAGFPELPRTPEQAADLVAKETKRPPPAAESEIDAAAIVAAVDRGLGALPAGHDAVVRWMQAALDRAPGDAYVLFGTWHDAPGHIDAFRRLVGPNGLRSLNVVAVEQLRADGAWRGAPAEAQRGDGELLDAWLARGDRAAFAALAERHREGDYAAWKLGYEPAVLDLLVNARATSVRLLGCDMPAKLQALAGAPAGEARNRLREIHCLRSLPSARPRRVALEWGDAHVRRSGLVRFVPQDATVLLIHAVGQRPGGGPLESALAKQIVVNDPVLVPLGSDEAALLLPDAILGGQIDRVLAPEDGAIATGVSAHAEIAGTLAIGGRTLTIGREPVSVPLAPGDHTYVFTAGGRRITGALRLAAGHSIELGFDPEARLTSYVER